MLIDEQRSHEVGIELDLCGRRACAASESEWTR